MARKHRAAEEEAAIDMTPMLDVVFIMLIFFIVTTSFIKEAGISVQRPKASQAKPLQPQKTIFIAINERGEIWMDKRQVDVERVSANIERMIAEQPSDSVILQADKDTGHGMVVKVMDQIKAAGIEKINISTESK